MARIAKENPRMLKQFLGGLGILTAYLFNNEIYGNTTAEIKEQFKETLGKTFDDAIHDRVEGLKKSELRALKEYHRRRKQNDERGNKLIGPIERRELIKYLALMAKSINDIKPDFIVALDKTGRPVGLVLRKILKEMYGLDLKLFFFDPGIIKLDLNKTDIEKFKTEHPHLSKMLNNATTVVIDDQVWSGRSFSNVNELFMRLGAKKVHFEYLSIYPAEPPPSWRTQKIHEIRDPEKDSFLALPNRDANRQKTEGLRTNFGFISKAVVNNLRHRK
jgi:hypoxanthine phosphoribosyltransferase